MVKNIILEAVNKNPIALKDAVHEELKARVAEILEAKMKKAKDDGEEDCEDEEESSSSEVNEASEDSPIAGTRKIKSFEGKNGHRAEVRHSKEWDEYSVHHYHNGKHMGEGPVSYHGDDKEDAMDTAQHCVNKMHVKDGHLHMNESEYDDLIAAYHARGGKTKVGKYQEPDEKTKAKLGATWSRHTKGSSALAGKELASMNTTDTKHNLKQAQAARKKKNEEVSFDDISEAVQTYGKEYTSIKLKNGEWTLLQGSPNNPGSVFTVKDNATNKVKAIMIKGA